MNRTFTTTDGVELSLSESGSGDPMVFQHGLTGDAAQCAQVFPQSCGFRRLTLECRGHGASEAGPPERFAIKTFADDVVDMIANEKLNTPVIGGISMGAAISLRLAVTRPELFRALVLVRPAWMTETYPENMEPLAYTGRLIKDHSAEGSEIFSKSAIAAKLGAIPGDNLTSLCSHLTEGNATVAELLIRISESDPGVSQADIAAIRIPTLVIGNADDYVHPLEYAETLAKTIPGANYVKITSKTVDPDTYADELRDILAAFLKSI